MEKKSTVLHLTRFVNTAVRETYDDILPVDYDANGHLHIDTVSKSQYKSKIFAHTTLSEQNFCAHHIN